MAQQRSQLQRIKLEFKLVSAATQAGRAAIAAAAAQRQLEQITLQF